MLLSDFLIPPKENQLEKFCLSIIWNLQTVFYHIDNRWKLCSLSKSECLTQPVQRQLSRNWKHFSEFFFCISEISIKFQILLTRRWATEIIGLWNYRLQKVALLKWLKREVAEHLWQSTCYRLQNTAWIWSALSLSDFLITLKGNQFKTFCNSSI